MKVGKLFQHNFISVESLESTSIRNISILEKLYSNMLEILHLENDITSLSSIVRLESYLHEGKTNYVEISQEPTIFFLPSIEGNETFPSYNY